MRGACAGVVLLLVSACSGAGGSGAQQEPTSFTVYSRMTDRQVTFKADLDVPQGNGPFPAVILLHGCGGLSPSQAPYLWRRALREMGYATLIIESFTPRDWPRNICNKRPEIGSEGQMDRLAEAFGAARMLRGLPFIKQDGIVLMGFSHGAGTVLYGAHEYDDYWTSRGHGHQIERFNGLIANYPWCEFAYRNPVRTPLLLLVGGADDYTPANRCVTYEGSHAPMSNGNINLRVYPGALHSFDSGQTPTVTTGCGGASAACGVRVSFGHSQAAFEQAKKDVAAFLRERLP